MGVLGNLDKIWTYTGRSVFSKSLIFIDDLKNAELIDVRLICQFLRLDYLL